MNLRRPALTGWRIAVVYASVAFSVALCASAAMAEPPRPDSPESRAVGFLAREVPLWSREHHCFSCHNNGDAARALFQAKNAGYPVPEAALADTTRWLRQPDRWQHNGGEGPFNDKKLARIAFAAALATSVRMSDQNSDKAPLTAAAEDLARDQSADGSWSIDGENDPGTPTAYGQPLATWLCRQTLATASPARYRTQLARADAWLAGHPTRTVTDASVALFAAAITPARSKPPRQALDLLKRAQASDDGGWGPFVTSPSEIFDTALAILALAPYGDQPDPKTMIARARTYLISNQQPDGSWLETTRPPGAVSYAQRISTTGWATLALLATKGPPETRSRTPHAGRKPLRP